MNTIQYFELTVFTLPILQLTSAVEEESSEEESRISPEDYSEKGKSSLDLDSGEGDASEGSSYNSTEYEKLLFRTLSAAKEQGESVIDRENVILETDINKVCDRLRSIDVLLTKMSQDPPANGGDDMVKLLRTYNQACLDLLFLCSKDKLKVLDMAQDILEPGGPKFFDIKIDKKKLQERFKWDEDKTDDMEDIMKKTYEHWNDMWYINNNFNPGK